MSDTDSTTEQMKQETGHSCAACPSDVRNMYAVAHNALNQWDVIRGGVNDGRMHRKMNDIRRALETFQITVDEHFKALSEWRKP